MVFDADADAYDQGVPLAQDHPGALVDVPSQLDVLPDGQQSLILGDVGGLADFNHIQGDNAYGFQQTCGLCSCQDVLGQFGMDVTETDVVNHAVAGGECNVAEAPSDSGGTTPDSQARLLQDYGVPAHVEQSTSLDQLAENVQHGRGVIIELNAGVLWRDPTYFENGRSNHAVVVTGIARDPATGKVQGFFVNDSGSGASGRFVDSPTMSQAWLRAGGTSVVTDGPRAPARRLP